MPGGRAATPHEPASTTRIIEFTTTEVTHSSVDVSPDGRTVVFDLLGDLYTVPLTGGEATPLTSGTSWDLSPRYSPDGTRIAFLSDRSGAMGLWTVGMDGTNPVQFTRDGLQKPAQLWTRRGLQRDSVWRVRGGLYHSAPVWTPRGELLTHASNELGQWRVVRMRGPAESHELDVQFNPADAALSADGRFAYVPKRTPAGAILSRLDLTTGTSVDLGVHGWLPRLSPDGQWLAYAQIRPGEFHPTSLVLRHLATGKERTLIDSLVIGSLGIDEPLPAPVPGYAFTPEGRSVVLATNGQLTRIDVATGARAAIPITVRVVRELGIPVHSPTHVPDDGELHVSIIRWPTVRPTSDAVAFSALGKLYVADLRSGKSRRLTTENAFEFAPAMSPDGKNVAYTTWADAAFGHVMVVPVEGGIPRRITREPGRYVNPAWSADGSHLVFVADTSTGRMTGMHDDSREGITLYSAPADGSGPPRYIKDVRMLRDRGRYGRYPVPAFSIGGQRVFVVDGANLVSMRLDGSDVVIHLVLPDSEDGAAVSPDGKWIALVWRERIYLAAIPERSSASDTARFSAASARLVAEVEGEPANIGWQDSSTLVWAIGNGVYRASIANNTAEPVVDVAINRPRARPVGTYALRHARIVTMRGDEVIEDGTIVVTNNRITAVGPSDALKIPAEAVVVDGKGATIIPGLVDVHAHMNTIALEVWQRQNHYYVSTVAHGITTSYDPSAPSLDVFGLAEMAEAGEILAPRIYSSGYPILDYTQYGHISMYGRGQYSGYPTRSDDPVKPLGPISSPEDARKIVVYHARHYRGPLKQYAQPDREQRQWLIAAARELGVPMTAEGRNRMLNLTQVADGYTAVEHTPQLWPLYSDVVQFLAASQVHLTPTLTVAENGFREYFGRRPNPVNVTRFRRFNPESAYARRFLMSANANARVWDDRVVENARAVARVVKAGGLVSTGSHGAYGLGLHWEMWGFVLGGMTPFEALRSATLIGAQKLDLDRDLGSIEVGKLADLVVLDANPLENIRNSTSIRYVILNGFVYDGPSMTRVWPSRQELAPWPWQSDEHRKRFAATDAASFPRD